MVRVLHHDPDHGGSIFLTTLSLSMGVGVLRRYVGVRRLRATKHMSLFQQPDLAKFRVCPVLTSLALLVARRVGDSFTPRFDSRAYLK